MNPNLAVTARNLEAWNLHVVKKIFAILAKKIHLLILIQRRNINSSDFNTSCKQRGGSRYLRTSERLYSV